MGAFAKGTLITRFLRHVAFDTLWVRDSAISGPGAFLLGSNVAIRDASDPFWMSYYL